MNEHDVICMWCGLRPSTGPLFGSPTCAHCRNGGRHIRVLNYLQRLRWAAERIRA